MTHPTPVLRVFPLHRQAKTPAPTGIELSQGAGRPSCIAGRARRRYTIAATSTSEEWKIESAYPTKKLSSAIRWTAMPCAGLHCGGPNEGEPFATLSIIGKQRTPPTVSPRTRCDERAAIRAIVQARRADPCRRLYCSTYTRPHLSRLHWWRNAPEKIAESTSLTGQPHVFACSAQPWRTS